MLFHANLVPVGSDLLVKEMVTLLRQEGYRFVNLSDLLKLGKPFRVNEGYFSKPKDNLRYDKLFGIGKSKQKVSNRIERFKRKAFNRNWRCSTYCL